MAWLEASSCLTLPPWLQKKLAFVCGLRASPRLLVGVCAAQFVLLLLALLQSLSRTLCGISVPAEQEIVVECDTCRSVSLSARGLLLHVGGALVISCGLLAVRWRDQKMLYIYGTCMLFFSVVIGLSAMLSALETPMLEVAVDNMDGYDQRCHEQGERMLQGARNHAHLNAFACLIDTAGAILAIRSKELFSYEEIASQHAEVQRAAGL